MLPVFASTPSFILWLDIILIIILVAIIANQLYIWYMGRKSAKFLSNDEFKTGLHRGQIIDLRDTDSFKASHILGARNMPFTQFQMYEGGLRKDLPVYLYDQGKSVSVRCAAKLRKNGFKEIYILDGGFAKWDGKTK